MRILPSLGGFWVGSMRWHVLNIGLAKIRLDFSIRLYGKTQTNFLANPILCQSFPGDSVVKNPLASTGDTRDAGSIPGLGRSPGRGNGIPLQYSCLENPIDRGDWQSTVHGVAKSQTPLSYWVTYTLPSTCHKISPPKVVIMIIISIFLFSSSIIIMNYLLLLLLGFLE